MTNVNNQDASLIGRIPPQSIDFEKDIIGAIMIEGSALDKVVEFLKPDMFYNSNHKKIYEAILDLYHSNSPIDMHTVIHQLQKNGTIEEVGGMYAIVALTTETSTSAHIVFHSLIVQQKYLAREIISLTSDIQGKAYDETSDVDDIINELETRFTEICMGVSKNPVKTMKEIVDETNSQLLELRRKVENNELNYICTPIPELDSMLKGGFKNKKLIVVGARPGMGKTQFILEVCKKASSRHKDDSMLLFELEMDSVELCIRLLVEEEAISDYTVETGTFSNEELLLIQQKLESISEMNILIDDREYNLTSIISKCKKAKRENKRLSLICLDYLQLIETGMKFQTRDLEVGYITRKLKQTSKELDIPIILLAQLNRDIMNEPKLENLRESGNIEQDADIVILIDRPTKREISIDPDTNQSWEMAGQFIVAKHRQGDTGKVKFSHDKRFKRMFSYRDLSTPEEVMQTKRDWYNQESRDFKTTDDKPF